MTELEKVDKTMEAIIGALNSSQLPPSTLHYMVLDIDRQIVESMRKEIAEDDHTE